MVARPSLNSVIRDSLAARTGGCACELVAWMERSAIQDIPALRSASCGLRAELLRHPVAAERAPAVGAVVGDVVAVLDDQELDRALDLAREPLGVLGRHDAVEPAVHDEDRAGDA